jgi:hypothetical protein
MPVQCTIAPIRSPRSNANRACVRLATRCRTCPSLATCARYRRSTAFKRYAKGYRPLIRCPSSTSQHDMRRRTEKQFVALFTLQSTRIAISPDIPPPHPAIRGTAQCGTELRRGIHLARPALEGGKWRGRKWNRLDRHWPPLTGSTVGLVDKPREGLGVSGAWLERRGGLAGERAGHGSVAYKG